MRVAMLSWESLYSIAVGGVAAHVSELAVALDAKGHEIHVFTRRDHDQPDYERIDRVHYHRCTYAAQADFVDDVNGMCGAFVTALVATEDFIGPFDIIHAHDWLAANALIWLKQRRGRRSVLTIHSTEYGRCGNAFPDGQPARIRYQERAGTYWADRVIAVSSAIKEEIRWMYEVPNWKAAVIPNGVLPERFAPDGADPKIRSEFAIGADDPMILFCGRMAWQKGPDLLLNSIPSVLKYYRDAKVVFVGDGDMRWGLEEQVRNLGLSSAVRFVGYRNGGELRRFFNAADIVCVPSRNEPFGIVVLEAWSAGKPVVVTQVGGPRDYVEHGVNGLKIFPTTDSVAWGLGTMLKDLAAARRMGEAGRRLVCERYTWDRIAESTLAVYDPDLVLFNVERAPIVGVTEPKTTVSEGGTPAAPLRNAGWTPATSLSSSPTEIALGSTGNIDLEVALLSVEKYCERMRDCLKQTPSKPTRAPGPSSPRRDAPIAAGGKPSAMRSKSSPRRRTTLAAARTSGAIGPASKP